MSARGVEPTSSGRGATFVLLAPASLAFGALKVDSITVYNLVTLRRLEIVAEVRSAAAFDKHRMKGCLVALAIPVGLVILVIGIFWLNFYDIHVRYRLPDR